MFKLIRHAAAVALLAIAGTASAASITLINPGPFNGNAYRPTVTNLSGGEISSLSIDLSGTTALGGGSLVFDGAFNSIDPAGGTATSFGVLASTLFGFNYTGFTNGLTHTFSWDPDIAGSGSYGAIVGEFVGALVSATVGGVNWSGTVIYDPRNDHAIATLTDGTTVVPVPGALVLMLSGLAGFGALARRKSAAA
jgi:hypothetical protein